MKILVIEDEVALCETIVSYLEEEGYRCEQAGTVELGSEKVNLYNTIVCWLTLVCLMEMGFRWSKS